MEWLNHIKSLLEEGSKLSGEVGIFFSSISPYVTGTLIFIAILYGLRRVPLVRAIHEYARTESELDREESEFIKMFQDPETRIKINVVILIGVIFLMLVYALLIFVTASFPFIVWYKGISISVFSTSMLCLGVTALEFWAVWLLMRFKEQTARAIRIDRETA
ncbi:MAG: hypothetical protein ACPF9K_02880 [Neptuniibacter sp.]